MKDEIAAAVFFITKLVKREGKLGKDEVEKFAARMTTVLFEKYKNHWYPHNPWRGQAFRCIRINKQQPRDPLLDQACAESGVGFSKLGLPEELTVWVDPYEVSCRYGERSEPFAVVSFGGEQSPELPQQINLAVGRAALDNHSGSSSDEESFGKEPRAIPTVSNPNSVYQFSDFWKPPLQPWCPYLHRLPLEAHGQPRPYRPPRPPRPAGAPAAPRMDRYHWVNTRR
ncbi:B915 protein, partial [Daphoenositta chrysoptera]|nr:B915 protein [Daphoenositta chrysoptera]